MNNFTQNNNLGNNYMNFGKQPRGLDSATENKLKENIPSDMNVSITSVMGDQEAFKFANIIKDFLSTNGYEVDGVGQAVYSEPVIGTVIEKNEEEKTVRIIVGSNS